MRLRRSLRFFKVCVASSWLGIIAGFGFPISVLYLFVGCSVLVIMIQLVECLLAAIHRHRSRIVPNSYYGPVRQEIQVSPTTNFMPIEEEYKQLLLRFTSDAVQEGVCKLCHSRHSYLQHFPFDPKLHFHNCPIPQMRAEVAEITYHGEKVSHEV